MPVPVLGSAYSAGESLLAGDWAGALGSGAGVVGDAVGFAVDPLGTLGSSAASFLLDRMQWWQDTLDVLAGNPDLVAGVGLTWSEIGESMTERADRLIALRDGSDGWWQGPAGDAFRRRLTEQAEQARDIAFVCGALHGGFAIGSGIVTVVREIISAICAELVGKLIAWVVQALATGGFGIPVIVTQATKSIVGWIDDAAKWVDQLLGATGKFCELLQTIYQAFDKLNLFDLGIGPDVVIGAGARGVDQTVQASG